MHYRLIRPGRRIHGPRWYSIKCEIATTNAFAIPGSRVAIFLVVASMPSARLTNAKPRRLELLEQCKQVLQVILALTLLSIRADGFESRIWVAGGRGIGWQALADANRRIRSRRGHCVCCETRRA